jgi:hypothetical protein
VIGKGNIMDGRNEDYTQRFDTNPGEMKPFGRPERR